MHLLNGSFKQICNDSYVAVNFQYVGETERALPNPRSIDARSGSRSVHPGISHIVSDPRSHWIDTVS